jgi:hypothetical protein
MEQIVNVEIKDFIGIYDNAYDQNFCRAVIDFFQNAQAAGYCYTRVQENNTQKTIKDDTAVMMSEEKSYTLSATKELSKQFLDKFWIHFSEYAKNKYSALGDSSDLCIDELKIQKTEVGQGFHIWHFEQGNRNTANRVCAFQLYLNDVDDGGETEFLYYPIRVKAKVGRLIVWPGSFTHTHRGNPPLTNTKYVITGWVTFK